jgi:hypothetical protein
MKKCSLVKELTTISPLWPCATQLRYFLKFLNCRFENSELSKEKKLQCFRPSIFMINLSSLFPQIIRLEYGFEFLTECFALDFSAVYSRVDYCKGPFKRHLSPQNCPPPLQMVNINEHNCCCQQQRASCSLWAVTTSPHQLYLYSDSFAIQCCCAFNNKYECRVR